VHQIVGVKNNWRQATLESRLVGTEVTNSVTTTQVLAVVLKKTRNVLVYIEVGSLPGQKTLPTRETPNIEDKVAPP
jgi:hypothetical protein